MSEYLQILVIAFVAQLAVLPGEKVQFIIAGLSTQYDPRVVVAAAGTAFAGWTALEITLGAALKGALPQFYLDAFTAVLFGTFAVLLLRSMPPAGGSAAESDGGIVAVGGELERQTVLGRDIPEYFGGFLPIFAMMAAGEFGDKTQLVTIGLATQYGATSAIWAGEMLAIIPVSIVNAMFFNRFAHRFDVRKAHLVSAGLFAFFAFDTVLSMATGISIWEQVVATLANVILSLG